MIRLVNINKVYSHNKIKNIVLKNLNLEVHQADMIAIMGRSGCGKATLLSILGALIPINSGNYFFNNKIINLNSSKETRI